MFHRPRRAVVLDTIREVSINRWWLEKHVVGSGAFGTVTVHVRFDDNLVSGAILLTLLLYLGKP